MHAWKHVFVHVDARPHAQYALGKALSVAEAYGGRVTAFDSVSGSEGLPSFAFTNLRSDHILELAAAARVRGLRDDLARLEPRVPVGTAVVKGLSADALVRHAQSNAADLILKAVSAAEVGQGTAAGVATMRLIREASVPVWVCSPHRRRSSRVLSAVNLSMSTRASERVIRAGARIAALQGAELHVLCVDRQASREVPQIESGSTQHWLDTDERELKLALGQLKTQSASNHAGIAEISALHTIERAIFELQPDVVVLSRDGRDLSGLRGTHLVERLFCRVESSMLLVPTEPQRVRSAAGLPRAEGRAQPAICTANVANETSYF